MIKGVQAVKPIRLFKNQYWNRVSADHVMTCFFEEKSQTGPIETSNTKPQPFEFFWQR